PGRHCNQTGCEPVQPVDAESSGQPAAASDTNNFLRVQRGLPTRPLLIARQTSGDMIRHPQLQHREWRALCETGEPLASHKAVSQAAAKTSLRWHFSACVPTLAG